MPGSRQAQAVLPQGWYHSSCSAINGRVALCVVATLYDGPMCHGFVGDVLGYSQKTLRVERAWLLLFE